MSNFPALNRGYSIFVIGGCDCLHLYLLHLSSLSSLFILSLWALLTAPSVPFGWITTARDCPALGSVFSSMCVHLLNSYAGASTHRVMRSLSLCRASPVSLSVPDTDSDG